MAESLSNMNAKQLAKEFKTVAKNIKNKDDAVKIAAMEKFHADARYMTEGGCIIPLLEVIQPKKKTLDFSLVALENLLRFMKASAASKAGGDEAEAETAAAAEPNNDGQTSALKPALDILQTVYQMSNEDDETGTLPPSLDALVVLAELIVYHDEVKKAKPVKVKKGELPSPVVKVYDTELSIQLRNGGLQATYLLVQALKSIEGASPILPETFATVPNITSNLCQRLCDLQAVLHPVPAVTEPESEEAAAPEEESEEDKERRTRAYENAMQECEWALDSLACLLRHSAQACQTMLKSPALEHLPRLSATDKLFMQPVLCILDALGQRCNVEDGDVNGLETIADPKYLDILLNVAAGAAQALTAVPEEGAEPEPQAEEAKQRHLLSVDTVVRTLTHVAKQQRKNSHAGIDITILTSENVPSLLKCLHSAIANEGVWALARTGNTVNEFVSNVCVLLGQIAFVNPSLRSCVCANGGVPALLHVLLNSADIKAGKGVSLFGLRRVCEQALFRLLTLEGSNARDENASARPTRWEACEAFSTDEDYFSESVITTDEEGETTVTTRAAEFMALMETLLADNDADSDLPDRASRIFAGLVASSKDTLTFLGEKLQVNTKISTLLAARVIRRGKAVVASNANVSEFPDTLLVPAADEALYLNLLLIEAIVAVGAAHVEAFAIDANIRLLSNAIFATGPTSGASIPEHTVYLFDPRQEFQPYGGRTQEGRLLRPLVFGVLAAVAEQSGGNGSAGLSVCKLVADACIATLSVEIKHGVQPVGRTAIVVPADGECLHATVLDAAVRCLHAMLSCGSAAIITVLGALAAPAERTEGGLAYGAVLVFKAALGEAAYGEVAPEQSVEVGEGEGEDAGEPQAVLSVREMWEASSQEVWQMTSEFAAILCGDAVPTTVTSLAQRSALWPFITLLSPLVGILANPRYSAVSATLAANAAIAVCRQSADSEQQELVYDLCSTVFVGIGGIIAVISALSPFGTLAKDNADIKEFVLFLSGRGSVYESVEPAEEEEIVPTAGLTREMWGALLDIWAHDMHLQDQVSTALLSAIRGGLTDQAVSLIAHNVNVNRTDGCENVTSLMFALALGQRAVVEALLSAGANVDAVDASGSPAVKYAFATIADTNIYETILGALKKQAPQLSCLGASPLVELLIDAGVDLLVSDRKGGNSAAHYCGGIGETTISIGGQICSITSGAYVNEDVVSLEVTCSRMHLLLTRGNANINASNEHGCVPFHVAAARGHIELMRLLHSFGAAPNSVDDSGFLPAHYAAACCPTRVTEALELALHLGENAAVKTSVYDNIRPDLNGADAKRDYDVNSVLDAIFQEATSPICVTEIRNSYDNLATKLTSDGFNILHLLLGGHLLQAGSCAALVLHENSKARRLSAVITLLTQGNLAKNANALINGVTNNSMTSMHAAALLLQGNTARVELTDAQKRSKRVKSYESEELHLLDLLERLPREYSSNSCTQIVPGCSMLGASWTPLVAAVVGSNVELITTLIPKSIEYENDEGSDVIPKLVDLIMTPGFKTETDAVNAIFGINPAMLASIRPNLLEQACLNVNANVVAAIASQERMNINVICEDGSSIFYKVVEESIAENKIIGRSKQHVEWDLFNAFAEAAPRLDLFAGNANVIELAVQALDNDILELLLRWRKNDVLEKVCMGKSSGADGLTALLSIEKENLAAASALGFKYIDSTTAGISESKDDAGTSESIAKLSDEERQQLEATLKSTNAVLTTLFAADLSFLDADCHAHACYSTGSLYATF